MSLFRLGAIHAPAPPRVPRLAAAVRPALATPKLSIDYHTRMALNGDALGNDRIGSCVPCAALRGAQIRRSFAWHDTWQPTQAQATDLYGRWGDYPAQDIGTDTARACTDYQQHGVQLSDQLLDVPLWVSLDPLNMAEIKLAIEWFGAVDMTLDLPIGAERTDIWDEPAPGTPEAQPWGAHRVTSGRYDGSTFFVVSWGLEIPVTLPFLLRRLLATDAMVSRTWLDATGLSPTHATYDDLLAERMRLTQH